MQDRDVYVISARGRGRAARQAVTDKIKNRGRWRGSDANGVANGDGWPRLAATCSIWLSGTGHFLHREWRAGLLYLLILGFAGSFYYLLHESWSSLRALFGRSDVAETDLLFVVLLIDLFLITILLSGIHSAYRLGEAHSRSDIGPPLNPLWPALASVLVPGWGQVVNGQIGKALAFLFVFYIGVFGVATWLVLPGPIGQLLARSGDPLLVLLAASALAAFGIVCWTLSLYDAILVARHRRILTALLRAR